MATFKTPKQHPFPHPPLEVGVAQYPTPVVPNYYTKDGHIILVVKESIEKGNYNPQPLDGSVTYTGRDANKWPSTLYLVYQAPTPDGEFVYNTYANDRTLASQDPWNYGLDYSANNPDFPITSRTYIVPRSQYSSTTLGSVDPVFGGTQIIAQQKMVELPDDNPLRSRYVAVQRVYESIPGPVLTGQQLDSRGDIETITKQTVAAGTAPNADGYLVTQTSVEPVDSVKSTKTYNTVASYATLTSSENKAGLLGDTSSSDLIVPAGTAPDALTTSVLQSSVEAITATKSRKRTTTSSGPTSLGGEVLGEFGVASASESIVSYGSHISVNQNTIKKEITPIDSAKSKLTSVEYVSPSVLTGYQYDDVFQRNLEIKKQIIPAGTSGTYPNEGLLSLRDELINPYQTQRTTVSYSSLPPAITEYHTGTYTSPTLVFSLDVASVDLSCGGTSDFRIIVRPNTRSSQNRQTTFKTITSYTYGPPTPADTDLFSPVLLQMAYTGIFVNFDFGGVICDAITPTWATNPCYFCGTSLQGCENISFPATSPLSATDYLGLIGTYVKISWESKYWRSGIYQSRELWVKLI